MSQTLVLPEIKANYDQQGQYEFNCALELWKVLGKHPDSKPKLGSPEILFHLCDFHGDLLGGLLVQTARLKHATTYASVLGCKEDSDCVRRLLEAGDAYKHGRAVCLVIDRVGDGTPDLVIASPGTGFNVLTDGVGDGDWDAQRFIGKSARELRITTWRNLLKRIGTRCAGA